ncbi:MAG TPA: hypothetical protein VHO01_02735 [Jatrophihabitans sp.]|nr:hypothetical protein [Jatrophihabitans sp.]
MLIWYLARGAGVAAFALLSVATAAGALTSRKTAAVPARVLTQYLHRSAALAGMALLALHILTVLADSYAHVGPAGVLVPFASAYRPLAVTFGVLALYLLVAVSLTGALRSAFTRSGRAVRSWRGIHLLSYAAWAAAGWHFWTAGTDAGQGWAKLVLLGGLATVTAAGAVRLAGSPSIRPMPARIGGRA